MQPKNPLRGNLLAHKNNLNIKTLEASIPYSYFTSNNVRIKDVVCFVNRVLSHSEIHSYK